MKNIFTEWRLQQINLMCMSGLGYTVTVTKFAKYIDYLRVCSHDIITINNVLFSMKRETTKVYYNN